MRIEVVGRNLEITPAIREYAESKADKLPRFYDGVQQMTATIAREDHQTHGQFGVDLLMDLGKHKPIVAKAVGPDLYTTIDQALDKAQRQLHDFKEKLRQGNR